MGWREKAESKGERKKGEGEREIYFEKNPQAVDGMDGGGSLHDEYGSGIFFMRMLWILTEIKHRKCYEQCLTHSKYLVNTKYCLYLQCCCYCYDYD